MGCYFSYARSSVFPTMFPENKTPVMVDVLEAGWILAFVILAVTLYLVLLGFRGMVWVSYFLWMTFSLFTGAAIMFANFGQEWEVGHINAITPYKAGSPVKINVTIGLKLGLRSVNITMIRAGEANKTDPLTLPYETINYNERFTWAWDQGRFGFGPYAGRLQQEFREAQMKGLPIPILWVVDYFVIDGEGLRFGRYYRTAGWYAHIAMWSAFPCWLLANILYMLEARYGGYFTTLTGGLQLLGSVLWAVIRNPFPLSIPFDGNEMIISYGSSFWLTIFSGSLSVVLGVLVIVMDLIFPDETTIFFGSDPLTVYDETYKTATEKDCMAQKTEGGNDFDMMEMNSEYASSGAEQVTQVVLERRSTYRNAQRRLIRKAPVPSPRTEDDTPVYLNLPTPGYSSESHGSRNRLYNN